MSESHIKEHISSEAYFVVGGNVNRRSVSVIDWKKGKKHQLSPNDDALLSRETVINALRLICSDLIRGFKPQIIFRPKYGTHMYFHMTCHSVVQPHDPPAFLVGMVGAGVNSWVNIHITNFLEGGLRTNLHSVSPVPGPLRQVPRRQGLLFSLQTTIQPPEDIAMQINITMQVTILCLSKLVTFSAYMCPKSCQ